MNNITFLNLAFIVEATLIFYIIRTFLYIYKISDEFSRAENFIIDKIASYSKPPLEDYDAINFEIGNSKAYKYYEFTRSEIEREDGITHQRLTWAISFQGFLIGAIGILLVFPLAPAIDLILMRKLALVGVGIWGALVAVVSLRGIMASRLSLFEAAETWKHYNNTWNLHPGRVPQAFGQQTAFSWGANYGVAVIYLFISMWFGFLIIFINVFLWIMPCIGDAGLNLTTAGNVSSCLTPALKP